MCAYFDFSVFKINTYCHPAQKEITDYLSDYSGKIIRNRHHNYLVRIINKISTNLFMKIF